MQTRQERLRAALTAAFDPLELEVIDDSARHSGHVGASPSGESHYTIKMVSTAFAGQSRIARSRAVHNLLEGEFRDGLHALSLFLRSPVELDPSQQAKNV